MPLELKDFAKQGQTQIKVNGSLWSVKPAQLIAMLKAKKLDQKQINHFFKEVPSKKTVKDSEPKK